ncbi:hypothetical protein COLO4_26268 [Corchorus olitorius]|uniref:Uncharacterized protein n=1 Tax=Corchorus olitorius TaxID=93759 RepID=A0A1R3HXT9_9ROSI|nr:hypothetical protein COLO4_26268 [Corchorus olitorius]
MAEGLSALWDSFHLTEEENLEGLKFDGPGVSETRTGRDDGREQSVNKDIGLQDREFRGKQGSSRQSPLQIKEAADLMNNQEFQADNDGVDDTNPLNIGQQEGAERAVEVRDSEKEVLSSKSSSQAVDKNHAVDMELGQTNTGDNFVFAASKTSSNGEGNKNGKRWKRAARSSSKMESGRQSNAAKISGKKREGSKGNTIDARKKSRDDGGLVSDDISDFNTPHMVERVSEKIQNCSLVFANWNKSLYGSLGLKINKIRGEISDFYKSNLQNRNSDRLNSLLAELGEL